MRKPLALATFGTALVVLTFGAAPLLTSAADHLDAPALKNETDHPLDITDIYAFDARNSAKTVLVMDVNPLAGVVSGTRFSTKGVYRFNLSRGATPDADLNDAKDRVYKVRFGPVNDQRHASRSAVYRNGKLIGTGKTGRTNDLGGGARIWAGLRDDPFFFDLAGYNQLKDSTYTDASGLTDTPGDDFFVGTNISTIVLEVPDSWIGAKANFWATTRRGGKRIDRMGKPGLNTVFIDPFKADATDKDKYNQTASGQRSDQVGPDLRGRPRVLRQLAGDGRRDPRPAPARRDQHHDGGPGQGQRHVVHRRQGRPHPQRADARRGRHRLRAERRHRRP